MSTRRPHFVTASRFLPVLGTPAADKRIFVYLLGVGNGSLPDSISLTTLCFDRSAPVCPHHVAGHCVFTPAPHLSGLVVSPLGSTPEGRQTSGTLHRYTSVYTTSLPV